MQEHVEADVFLYHASILFERQGLLENLQLNIQGKLNRGKSMLCLSLPLALGK